MCAIVGTVAYIIFALTHGDLPEGQTVETILRFVAARPAWRAVHLLGIFAFLLWAGALVALTSSLTAGSSGALARLGQASLLIATTVLAIDFTIDGWVLKTLADAWASAPASQQANLLLAGDLLFRMILGATAWSAQVLLGLSLLVYGLAVLRSRAYPVWMGWIGTLGGAGWLAVGIVLFVSVGFLTFDHVVPFQLFEAAWMLGMGVLMWHRASKLASVAVSESMSVAR